MVLKEIEYFTKGKSKKIEVEVCDSLTKKIRGLMFRKNSFPLLFIFNKEKKISIHSLFCRPFTAVWLNEKKRSTKIVVVKKWKFNISGRGKYLLEIPISLDDDKLPTSRK